MNKRVLIAQLGAVLVLTAAGSATASPITFDFNSLASNANNSAVQAYMNLKLGSAGSVTVTGSQADNGYTGDDHVVGPDGHGNHVDAMTLGNTEGATKDGAPYTIGATDRFITNQPGTTDSIVMKFTGLTIASVSFDYEIFPDASCADGNHCGGAANYPDLKFRVNGSTQIFQLFGVMPGTNGTYSDSPELWKGETAPQLLGTTGILFLPPGVTELDFVDWPAAIGIDNLRIDPTTVQAVPEPASLVLFGTGLLAVGYRVSRRKKS